MQHIILASNLVGKPLGEPAAASLTRASSKHAKLLSLNIRAVPTTFRLQSPRILEGIQLYCCIALDVQPILLGILTYVST